MIPGTTNREMEEKRENPNIEPKLVSQKGGCAIVRKVDDGLIACLYLSSYGTGRYLTSQYHWGRTRYHRYRIYIWMEAPKVPVESYGPGRRDDIVAYADDSNLVTFVARGCSGALFRHAGLQRCRQLNPFGQRADSILPTQFNLMALSTQFN